MAGRAVVRVAHRAACGVSPLSGFHRPLAPLGWRLPPGLPDPGLRASLAVR